MNGLGGLNKSPEGVVIGLVQLQLPVVITAEDLAQPLLPEISSVDSRRAMGARRYRHSRD